MEEKSFKEIREEKGIKLSHIAKVLNVSTATIRNKEGGKTDFTAPEARKLCHIYNVDFNEVKF